MGRIQARPQTNEKFDLYKHRLDFLEGRNVLILSDAEMDMLLKALGEDDIAVRVPITSAPENIRRLLAVSECRRCGRCCSPDRPNPDNPGVEALEDELEAIARHLGISWETLKENTARGKAVYHPAHMSGVSFTRYLPLPCPYYDKEARACAVYEIRPIVCTMHPIVFSQNDLISVRVACDYGKDVLKAAFKEVLEAHPGLEMKL